MRAFVSLDALGVGPVQKVRDGNDVLHQVGDIRNAWSVLDLRCVDAANGIGLDDDSR
jgi:hypothetical protein